MHIHTIICMMSFVAYRRSFRSENLCPHTFYFRLVNKAKSIGPRSGLYGIGVLKKLKKSVFPFSILCDSICKPLSYKEQQQKHFGLHRNFFCVHTKLNDGPVLQDIN